MPLLLVLLSLDGLFFGHIRAQVRFAAPQEDIGSSVDSVVRANNGGLNFFFANYELSSGEADTSSLPALTWVALTNGNAQELNITIADNSLVPDITGATGQFQTYLRLANRTGQERYLYASVQDPNDSANYKIVTTASSAFESQTETELFWHPILFDRLCNSIDCSDLLTGTSHTEDVLIYFFLDEQSNRGFGTDVDPSVQTGGVYLRLYLSVRIPIAIVTLNELTRGDTRLKVSFEGQTIDDFDRFLGLVNANGAGNLPAGGSPVQDALMVMGTELRDFEQLITSGEVNLTGLENGVAYEVSLAFEDKFLMASPISDAFSEVPMEIEALLEKEACYILSAGFAEEHYITDFFKKVRDKIMLKSILGRSFVDWYYETAPHYTPLIYSSALLSWFVRCGAYIIWFCWHAGFLILPVGLVAILMRKISRQRVQL